MMVIGRLRCGAVRRNILGGRLSGRESRASLMAIGMLSLAMSVGCSGADDQSGLPREATLASDLPQSETPNLVGPLELVAEPLRLDAAAPDWCDVLKSDEVRTIPSALILLGDDDQAAAAAAVLGVAGKELQNAATDSPDELSEAFLNAGRAVEALSSSPSEIEAVRNTGNLLAELGMQVGVSCQG